MTAIAAIISIVISCLWGCNQTTSTDPETKTCAHDGEAETDYLNSIQCPSDFTLLQGKPLNQIYGDIHSIKFLYSIQDDSLYFINTKKFSGHYSFSKQVLAYPKSAKDFNNEQYYANPNRLYFLGSLNYYMAAELYTMEFVAGDQINGEQIELVYNTLLAHCYFSEKIKFYPTSSTLKEQALLQNGKIPIISSEELFKEQNYQALHVSKNYGYLEKIESESIENSYLSRHNIVLTNGVPNNIPVVAGIITTDFQTPFSHINVLSQNRDTPNMALRMGWEDTTLNSLLGKLVYFEVKPDTFLIYEASLSEAEAFWLQNEPSIGVELECNDSTSGFFDMDSLDYRAYSLVGSKAANFAELKRIDVDTLAPLPVPEGGFAIPFFYYRQHLQVNGLDTVLTNMLSDSGFQNNVEIRKLKLLGFTTAIEKAPINPDFLKMVTDKIKTKSSYTAIRFRSSTNAEDTEFFNGAGLYASKTGRLEDPDKPIDKAIKKVWASLWTFRAFEERAYYKIDQMRVAMGILVHRSFPDELANGVAITVNIYNQKLPGYTINVQQGETSVVSPEPGITCDQLLFYPFYQNAFENPVIEYITHSSLTDGTSVLADSEVLLLSQYLYRIILWFHNNVYTDINPPAIKPAMDVEFKFDSPDRKLYIKQVRPYSLKAE